MLELFKKTLNRLSHITGLGRGKLDRRIFLRSYLLSSATVGEIGVWKGDFSDMVLSSGKIKRYYLIDPFSFMPKYPNRMYGGKVARSQQDMDEIYQLTKKRLKKHKSELIFCRKNSNEAVADIPDETLDFLYIDGDHHKTGVSSDILNYRQKMKIGGYLVFDDWHWRDDNGLTSVKEATMEYLSMHPNSLLLVEIKNNQAVFIAT